LGIRTTLVVQKTHNKKARKTLSCKFCRPILIIAPGLKFAL